MIFAVWNQRYGPVANNLALSALVAALPVIVLLGLLGLLRIRAHYAALAGATPRPIMVCSRARSASDRTTTCRLRISASCGGGLP